MEFPVEILLLVFSNAEPKELAAAARVCQEWSTLALDILWRDLDSLNPLVELVVPIVQTSHFVWSAASIGAGPTEFQWKRYDSYADRVRSIIFHDGAFIGCGRDSAVTTELIRSLVRLHPRGAFCPPRLRKMTWTSIDPKSVLAMVLFPCDTLRDLTAYLHTWKEDKRGLIEEVASRAPHLKSLSLALPVGLENSLVQWLSKLPLLESVSLPTDYQTTAIVEALGDLAYLTRLRLRYGMWHSEKETTNQCLSFNSPSGFPRLETLDIDASIGRLVRLFQTSERFAQVKQIALSSNCPAPEKLFNLAAAVAQQCPGITTITLQFPDPIHREYEHQCSLSFQQTRPLLACHSLEVFKIETRKPFSINEQDLRDMALAWPGIQELGLSSSPYEEMNLGGFPLWLLPIAAGLFPTLQILRIYLDPEGDTLEFDYNTLSSSGFQSLRVLDVGTSSVPADPSTDLGSIIGSLCKLEVRIEGAFESVETNPHERVTGWNNVQDVVTMLVKSKKAMP